MKEEKNEGRNTLLKDELKDVLSMVIDWLKYADQKLAGLIVLNGGLVWGITRYLNHDSLVSEMLSGAVAFGYFLLILSLLIASIAMLPILTKKWLIKGSVLESDNLMYFSDIKKYNKYQYMKKMIEILELGDIKYGKIDLLIAEQIVNNSEVAALKFQRLKLASWVTILGVLIFSAVAIYTYFQG